VITIGDSALITNTLKFAIIIPDILIYLYIRENLQDQICIESNSCTVQAVLLSAG